MGRTQRPDPGGIRLPVLSTPEKCAPPTPQARKRVPEKMPWQPHWERPWAPWCLGLFARLEGEKPECGGHLPASPHLRQPCPVPPPTQLSLVVPEQDADIRRVRGAGRAVLGRGKPGSALPGPRHGPQTEAKPWKRDHIMRALVFDNCSLNKLENKCLTLSQSKYCPWSRLKPVQIRASGSYSAGWG